MTVHTDTPDLSTQSAEDIAAAYRSLPVEGAGKCLARKIVFGGVRHSGLMRLHEKVRSWTREPFMTIVLFHRVTDAIPADALTVGLKWFREFCDLMKRSYYVVPLDEIYKTLNEGGKPAARTIAITFDDCYHDNLRAAELLAEHGLPATFFVPSGFVGRVGPMPWDMHLPPMNNLTWEDLRRIVGLGHGIGSHTVTHPDLSQLTVEQTREELLHSKKTLEDNLGQRVRYFAYPFGGTGNFRAEQLPLVYEAGYEGCVSAEQGFVEMNMKGQVLPRVPMPPYQSMTQLEMRLTRCLEWARAFKRATSG